MLVESLTPKQTLITLFLPETYHFAQTRFKQDIQRALGQDKITIAMNWLKLT